MRWGTVLYQILFPCYLIWFISCFDPHLVCVHMFPAALDVTLQREQMWVMRLFCKSLTKTVFVMMVSVLILTSHLFIISLIVLILISSLSYFYRILFINKLRLLITVLHKIKLKMYCCVLYFKIYSCLTI